MTHYGIDPIDDEGEMSRCAPDADTIKIEWDKDSLTQNTFPTDKRSRCSSRYKSKRESSSFLPPFSDQAARSNRQPERGFLEMLDCDEVTC